MNKEANSYTIIFVIILIFVIASSLTVVNFLLLPKQKHNMETEKKQNILRSINVFCSNDSVEYFYEKYIIDSYIVNNKGETLSKGNAFLIDLKEEAKKNLSEQKIPIFIAKAENNNYKTIFTLIGKGLWGEISGYVSLNEDNNTIYGITFNHKSETPGLGAEISDRPFQEKFIGKKIYDENFLEISLKIVKNSKENNNEIDALSGATITSSGINKMISDCMLNYKNYIIKKPKP